MKPRLIDANELIKCIDKWYESCSPRTDLRDMVICDTLDSVLQHLDNIPTAYDVDKVVEALGDEYDNAGRLTGYFYNHNTYETHGYMEGLKKAIEIVKGGADNV